MDGNTSTCPILESLANAIDFLPGATMLVAHDGRVQRCNAPATRLLGVRAGDSLLALGSDRAALARHLRAASRSSGTLPIAFDAAPGGQRVAATLKAVRHGRGGAAEHLLVSCQSRPDVAHKMRMLNRELDRAIARQRSLRAQNDSLRQTVEVTLPQLRAQTFRDPLTGCYNRRYFDRQLEREWHRAQRDQAPLSLVYADIDHFKQYNDSLGHHRGDRCLQAVAQAFQRALSREFDCCCRLGGEEFALLLPMTPEKGAICVAERALYLVRRLSLRHPGNVVDIVTASCGVGTCLPASTSASPDDFVAAVDRAMYRAKRAGRNQLAVCADIDRAGKAPGRREVPASA